MSSSLSSSSWSSDECIVFVIEKEVKEGDESLGDEIEFFASDKRFMAIKEEGEKENSKPFTTLHHSHLFSAFLTNKNKIYKVGGDSSFCNKCRSSPPSLRQPITNIVEWFDISQLSSAGWRNLPLMNVGRRDPHAHIIGNHMYVIGGYCGLETIYEKVKKHFPFMECLPLDDQEAKWSPVEIDLHQRTVDMKYYVSANIKTPIVDVRGVRVGPGILFGFSKSNSFYIFKPLQRTWEYVSHLRFRGKYLSFCAGGLSVPALVFRHHLLWIGNLNRLIGMNIVNGRYFSISLGEEQGLLPDPCLMRPRLVLLENDEVLALVWIEEGPNSSGYHVTVTKFIIDLGNAHLGQGPCTTVVSSTKGIAPASYFGYLAAVFTMNLSDDDDDDDGNRYWQRRFSNV